MFYASGGTGKKAFAKRRRGATIGSMELFETETIESQSAPTAGKVVGVVVNANLWRSFDYLWPGHLGTPQVGQRVRVPFGRGNRPTLGFVCETDRRPGTHKLKPITELIDPEPQLDEVLWKLGKWIGQYYLSPLGMTLAAMIPSAVGKHAQQTE